MLVLGIETSCDDTAVSVVEDGRYILSNIVSSQVKVHRKYRGVVPELASRQHLKNINWVINQALEGIGLGKIGAIAVTQGPGLIGSLLIGTETAKVFAFVRQIPLIPVNHIEGHIFANFLEHEHPRIKRDSRLQPPFIGLIISGGHSDLIYVRDFFRYKILGRTRDDAVGEAFDKVAKLLNLGYPGGPVIDKLSREGNPSAIKFPRPYLPDSWDFSFSGLKTAVVNYVKSHPSARVQGEGRLQATGYRSQEIADIVASFQSAVIDVLVRKAFLAAQEFQTGKIVLGGGVAANSHLRKAVLQRGKEKSVKVYFPPPKLCTDNAAMIACAGWHKYRLQAASHKSQVRKIVRESLSLNARANLPLVH